VRPFLVFCHQRTKYSEHTHCVLVPGERANGIDAVFCLRFAMVLPAYCDFALPPISEGCGTTAPTPSKFWASVSVVRLKLKGKHQTFEGQYSAMLDCWSACSV
jgi:hypothetical protein